MKIAVEVKANSKQEAVELIEENTFRVRVRAPPVDGKANDAVIAALAAHFKVSQSAVLLLRGEKSKKKLFEIIFSK